METNTFCIPEAKRAEVEKLIARESKKAAKYGATLRATYGQPYAKKVKLVESDPYLQCYKDRGSALFEVFDLIIESEVIKADGYEVVAMIEHLKGGNIVTMAKEVKPEWTTMPPYCEHCHGNHGQRTTFIVRHESGAEKQVGKTCLKEYCGINPQAIGWAKHLGDCLDIYEADHFDFYGSGLPRAYQTIDVLALAIEVYEKQGYIKVGSSTCNRDLICKAIKERPSFSSELLNKARRMAEAVEALDDDQAFKANLTFIKTLVVSGYCKASHIGFIAYAPQAYEEYLERLAKNKSREEELAEERATSKYVGEVGKRMTFKVKTFKLVASWETAYGYTHLYKFKDMDGNVLMWFSSSGTFGKWNEKGEWLLYEPEDVHEIAATVKSHNERDGVKQTILTRVKVKG